MLLDEASGWRKEGRKEARDGDTETKAARCMNLHDEAEQESAIERVSRMKFIIHRIGECPAIRAMHLVGLDRDPSSAGHVKKSC